MNYYLNRILLVGFVAFQLSPQASAGSVEILGRSIEISPPAGYCQIGGNPKDMEILNHAKEVLNAQNRLLMLFANCDELSNYRKNSSKSIDNYGWILATTQRGELREFKNENRRSFIEKMRTLDFSQAFHDASEKHKEQFEGVKMPTSGVLASDNNAVYVGALSTMGDLTGLSRKVSVVLALTFVKYMPFSINLYHAYKKSSDIPDLLIRQQSAAAEFVRANE